MFNPDDLLHSEIGGENSTAIIPVPTGEWTAQCGKPTFRQNTIKKGERAGEMLTSMDVPMEVLDQEVKDATNRDKPSVRWSTILQLDESGGISTAEGENVQLGRLRAAIGENENPEFTPAMIEGQTLKVTVKHRTDPDDPELVYAEVSRIRPLD